MAAHTAAARAHDLISPAPPLPPAIRRDVHGKPILPLDRASIYRFGHLIRSTEQLLLDLFGQGLLSGTTHTCLGQEICQMAVVRSLVHPDDVVLSNHRNHGHFLTYSGEFFGLVAELMGREAGICRGIGGSQHLMHRHFHSNGVQAGMTALGVGMARALKTRASDGIVACVVGDGTLGEGLLYESLNLASVWQVPMLFVVERNAIAQTTPTALTTGGSILARGAAFGLTTWAVDDADADCLAQVDDIVGTVRATRQPGFLVIETARLGPHSKGDDLRDPAEIDRIGQRDPLARIGATLSVEARTAIEQENAAFLLRVREAAAQSPESRYAEPPRHAFGGRRPASVRPPRIVAPAAVNVRGALNAALRQMLGEHPEVILLGEDLHDPYGGAFKVTAGLSTAYPDRVISTPISEAGIVGAGIGLALAGYRPIVEIMFADFIALAMDQIYNHAAKFPGMFDGVEVPLVIRTPSGGRRGYGPTHSQSPEHLLVGMPGITVVFGSHRHDAGELIRRATFDWPYPIVSFEHKLLYGETQDSAGYIELPPEAADPGAAVFPTIARPRSNPDLTAVTYGGMLPLVERAADVLEQEEFSVEIVVPSLLQPLPLETLVARLLLRPHVAIVEEAPVGAGFGAALAAALLERGFRGRLRRIGAGAVPIPAARSLEAQVLPDERSVLDQLVAFLTESDGR
jgi:2-oxoisovalerate dehydrogenase E1 component